jgi:hypothetical protein
LRQCAEQQQAGDDVRKRQRHALQPEARQRVAAQQRPISDVAITSSPTDAAAENNCVASRVRRGTKITATAVAAIMMPVAPAMSPPAGSNRSSVARVDDGSAVSSLDHQPPRASARTAEGHGAGEQRQCLARALAPPWRQADTQHPERQQRAAQRRLWRHEACENG